MKIKTYRASSMDEAVALAKRELGPDPLVLHARTYRRGGLFGLGSRRVAEVTAAVGVDARKAPRRPAAGPPRGGPSPRAAPAGTAPPDHAAQAGDLIRRVYQTACRQSAAPGPEPAGTEAPSAHLAAEVQSLRRMVGQVLRQQSRWTRQSAAATMAPGPLFDQYLHLLEQEVAEELADQVVEEARRSIGDEGQADAEAVRRALLGALSRLIPIDEEAGRLAPTADGRPRTIALVGPTGVGKTTTIAKLAANFKLKQKRRVSLLTLDTYRIAAVDQLRTYADIIGVPLQVVGRPDEVVEAMRGCAGSDVVLIDTAGRGQRDDAKLEQLASLVQAARPHEVHLVLSSTCAPTVLLDTVERFDRIRADRIIFTKLDEAVSFGVLVTVARRVNKRLSYVTTGQEVPHQIECGRADRLAALVLDPAGGVVGAAGSPGGGPARGVPPC